MTDLIATLQAAAGNAAGEGLYVEEVFSTYLYDGNASSQTITNGINLEDEGGLTWFKGRDATTFHILIDTERGGTKWLRSGSSNGESTVSPAWVEFNTDGFNLPQAINGLNNTQQMVSWTFRKAPKFFDVVTYTGTGSAQNISHNLGSVPGAIFIKRTSSTEDWLVYHRSTGNEAGTGLNETAATYTGVTQYWNSTTPTDSVFTVNTHARVNTSGETYVAYLFAHNDGDGEFGEDADQDIIKCGSYTGNDGTQDIDVGFEPQWVMIKNTDNTSNWAIFDVMRGFTRPITTAGPDSIAIYPNTAGAEVGIARIFPTANGFGFISEAGGTVNTVHDFIYIAIRRGPMKTPESGTEVFAADSSPNSNDPRFISGFPVDMAMSRKRTSTGVSGMDIQSRLTGNKYMRTGSTNAEASSSTNDMDYMNGFDDDGDTATDFIAHMFRRAPGFFDVVAYVGTGSAQNVSHNLEVSPELLLVKRRDSARSWRVFTEAVGNTGSLRLDSDAASDTGVTAYWNNTSPTESVFTVGTDNDTNASGGAYIAYLFATVPGVSKVGSYTGNGTSQTIDCGFSNGARFVLIKESSGAGDWNVFDTERGIVAGNDPRLELNTSDAEDTGDDFVDPVSSGFAVTSDTKVNTNNATYVFLAIA